MTTYKILSLDGGGIRGLLTTVLLKRLLDAVPGWLDQVDLLAGTSTGGIIALGLAHGLELDRLQQLYYKRGHKIFDDTDLNRVSDPGQLPGAKYDNRWLRQEVKKVFGQTRLKELQKHVLIPAFDLDNHHRNPLKRSWKPKFFHNLPGRDSDGETKVYKVAVYTSSAPTYFPSFDGYIDGGVVANNPSLAAVVQTQDSRCELSEQPRLDEIVLFSMGTGQPSYYLPGRRHDWGYHQWAQPMVTLMMDGSMGVADYQCQQLLGEQYHRLAPVLLKGIDMDNWRKRDELIRFAQEVDLTDTIGWLSKHWG